MIIQEGGKYPVPFDFEVIETHSSVLVFGIISVVLTPIPREMSD